MMRPLIFSLLVATSSAFAIDLDAAALALADSAPDVPENAKDLQIFIENALGRSNLRNNESSANQRLSFDIYLDKPFAPDWRLTFSDRLDMNWQESPDRQNGVNSLKEAYVSWQPKNDQLLDLGRVNARFGVAVGYNPTDFFRRGANRSIVSIDPVSLKKNRLGSGMLRSQTLWSGGSLTAIYSPRLARQSNDSTFSADFGATNDRNRWLIAGSQQITNGVSPQLLLYREEQKEIHVGFNLATLLNSATVNYIEWSGGRSPSQFAQAISQANEISFHSRLSTGVTYTTSNKISLTLEYQYNGAALDRDEWNALRNTRSTAYGLYRKWTKNEQELPTKQALFFFGTWQDAIIRNLDLSAMVRFNVADRSLLHWLEARYHWNRAEVALQWQLNRGDSTTEYGAAQQQGSVQALFKYFY